MSGKKWSKAVGIVCLVVLLLLIAGAAYFYFVLVDPNLSISRGVSDSEEYGHMEIPMIAFSEWVGAKWDPRMQKIDRDTKEIVDWANPIIDKTMEVKLAGGKAYMYLFGEVRDGKTRLWYDGYLMPKDEEPYRLYEEKVFDFVLVPNDELLTD